MAQVDIGPDEGHALVARLNELVEQLRSHTRTITGAANELASANYVSDTTHALQGRWEGETLPQFQKVFNRVEEANHGTTTGINTQMDHQRAGMSAINGA